MEKMIKVSKEIVNFEIDEEVMEKLLEPFYRIMEDNGIEWGTPSNGGVTGANYEWTMPKNHFIQSVVQQIEWAMVMNLFDDEGEVDEIQS